MTREQILKKAKENPKDILYLFTKNNFRVAKAFWGKKSYKEIGCWAIQPRNKNIRHGWRWHLQQMIPEEELLKYIEEFL